MVSTHSCQTTGRPTRSLRSTTASKLRKLSVLDNRLASGKALGTIIFSSSNNVRFRCTRDCIGGRGLRVVDRIGTNITIARGLGTIQPISDGLLNSPLFKVHDTKSTVLVLQPPSTAMPANLANTSASKTSRNNCKIVHKSGTNYFSIVTTRNLEPGDEVTVPYGNKFTKTIVENNVATLTRSVNNVKVNCNAKLRCPVCNHLIKKRCLPRHTNSIVCKNFVKKSYNT